MKKTVVIGASPNPERYSFKAVSLLKEKGFTVIPLGVKKGAVSGISILNDYPLIDEVHTITLYIGLKHQFSLYNYILGLKPKRLIFNPGTENLELFDLARDNGVEVINACTLVMLSVGNY